MASSRVAYGVVTLLALAVCVSAAVDTGASDDAPASTGPDVAVCMSSFAAFDFSDVRCFKKVIVKLLGFAIIAGAFTYKVPQIKKLVDAQEARGLSFLSTYVETACFGSVVVYHVLMGNPVSAWGENAIIMLQQVAVMGLMWKYTSTSTAHVALVSAGLLGLFAFQLSLPQQYWHYIFGATIPAFSAARIPQIYENFKNGHTGLLAVVTVFMGFAGSLARVFTSLEEVTDMQVAVSFVLGAVWNTILLLQIFWYWNRTNEVMSKKDQ